MKFWTWVGLGASLFGIGMARAMPMGCRYLELRAPGGTRGEEMREVPLYMAYPDSLGQVSVTSFLQSGSSKADSMLRKSDWQVKPLTQADRSLLDALRNLLAGRVREAGEEMSKLSSKAPTKMRSVLQVNRGMIFFLAGFSTDAEKEWRAVLASGSECEEVAWRNLYSLYLGNKNFAKAHGLVDDVLREDPKNKWANAAKGYLVRMLTTGDAWEDFLKNKSTWKDSLFEIQIAYGTFLKDQGQLEEARKYYTRGLEGAPRNGQAWLELADVQYRLGYYVFAETCLRKSFAAGVSDIYVYELYGKVLTGISTYAATGRDMRELGFGWDAAWAAGCWRMAERVLEDGFPHDLHSRSMAHLLYRLYCHNGKVEAARNLRENFWFHFSGPAIPKTMHLGYKSSGPQHRLRISVGYIGYPLLGSASASDFYEPF